MAEVLCNFSLLIWEGEAEMVIDLHGRLRRWWIPLLLILLRSAERFCHEHGMASKVVNRPV